MSRRVISSVFLREEAARAHAGAYSETAISVVGRARLAWELAHGESGVPGEPAGSPLNPQGLVGVDMSGPPWGPALRLPVAQISFSTTNESVTPTHNSVIGAERVVLPVLHFWNRPHAVRDDGTSPLSRLLVRFRATRSGPNVSTTFVILAENLTTGDRQATSHTFTSNTTSNVDGPVLLCAPGRNAVRVTGVRTAGTRSWEIHSLMLYVLHKRRSSLTFPG